MTDTSFVGSDIVTLSTLRQEQIEMVIERAGDMKRAVESGTTLTNLNGKLMTALFYEPSSRTFASFVAAMNRLGGSVIPIYGVTYSSVSKGESLEDTVRTFASYSDVLVIRYPHVGGAKIASDLVDIPVINAGDGNGEHPTQALLDFFTIRQHFDNISKRTITLVGDLLNGRTVHSLIHVLLHYRPEAVHFVSPEELKIPDSFLELLKKAGILTYQSDSLDEALPQTDVLYVTRVQRERFKDLDMYERLKHRYVISRDSLQSCKKDMIIMHPFPRVGEITPDIDSDPRAVYLTEQMKNGMYVRMALLSLVLGA